MKPGQPKASPTIQLVLLSMLYMTACSQDDTDDPGRDLTADTMGDLVSDLTADGDLEETDRGMDIEEAGDAEEGEEPLTPVARELQASVLLGEGGFFGVSGAWLSSPSTLPPPLIAIGAHYADISGGVGDPNPAGRLYLFSGEQLPANIQEAFAVLQPPDGSAGGGFAYSIGNLCDANGDGALDLPVGNHLYLDPTAPNAGRVIMFWGDERGMLDMDLDTSIHRLSDGLRARSDVLGQTVLCVDIDDDGLDDLIATGQNAGPGDTGLAAIYYGSAQGLPGFEEAVLVPPLSVSRQYFGSATLWHDLDGDDASDLAVGGWGLIKGASTTDPHTGGVLVYAGGQDWWDGPTYRIYPASDGPEGMGVALATAETGEGDLLLVGAANTGAVSEDDPAAGAVYVYRLGGTDFADSPVQVLSPPQGVVDVGFGQRFAYSPDHYGSGRGALLVGMKHGDASSENTGTGAVAVFRLRLDDSSPLPFHADPDILLAPDPQGMDAFGGSIVVLGDVDGDGQDDLFVGMESHIEGDYVSGTQTGGVVFYH
ncbi:MAG: hypothetical protein JW797_20590 [Bradymonadales bacterium]|nr:hypothetical protein [Bradymonadales bacterium]